MLQRTFQKQWRNSFWISSLLLLLFIGENAFVNRSREEKYFCRWCTIRGLWSRDETTTKWMHAESCRGKKKMSGMKIANLEFCYLWTSNLQSFLVLELFLCYQDFLPLNRRISWPPVDRWFLVTNGERKLWRKNLSSVPPRLIHHQSLEAEAGSYHA